MTTLQIFFFYFEEASQGQSFLILVMYTVVLILFDL
jgi:hypothetical protein